MFFPSTFLREGRMPRVLRPCLFHGCSWLGWFGLFACSFVRSFIGSFVAGLTRRSPVPSPGTHTRDRVGKREGPGNGACLERPKRELNSRQFFTVHFVENAGKQSIFDGTALSTQIARKSILIQRPGPSKAFCEYPAKGFCQDPPEGFTLGGLGYLRSS